MWFCKMIMSAGEEPRAAAGLADHDTFLKVLMMTTLFLKLLVPEPLVNKTWATNHCGRRLFLRA